MTIIVVIGLGEIGKIIHKKIENNIEEIEVVGLDVEPKNIAPNDVFAIHICFPEHNYKAFVCQINRYIKKFDPVWCIIHSTISLDTAEELSKEKNTWIYHIPIRGTHGEIESYLNRRPLYVGPANEYSKTNSLISDFKEYINRIFKVEIRWVNSIKESALSKILSVVWYGMNISFVQGVKMLCNKRGINFDQAYTKHFEDDYIGDKYYYNRNYKKIMANNTVKKQVFYPGVIGGKCVIQDVVLLEKDFPKLAEFVIGTNEEFKDHNE